MKTIERFKRINEEISYCMAERRQLTAEGAHLIVTHGYRRGWACLPGETIEQVCLGIRWSEIPIHLSPAGLVIVDCLVRYRRTPMSAARLALALTSPFYTGQGRNAPPGYWTVVVPSRASIKVHIQRIREQMSRAFVDAGLIVNPHKILVSNATDSNIILYQLRATAEVRHLDDPALKR